MKKSTKRPSPPARASAAKQRRPRGSPAKAGVKASPSPGRPQLLRVFDQFEKAAELAKVRIEAVQTVLGNLIETARQRDRETLVEKLAETGILDYAQQLAGGFQNLSPDDIPDSLRPFRAGPAALLDFLNAEFHLSSKHLPGEPLQLDERDLPAVRFASPLGRTPALPASVVVTRSGWKVGSRVIVKPTVELVQPADPLADAASP